MYATIRKKRDGEELSRAEIRALVSGYVGGSVPDYQIAAWLMAVYFRGMSARETADLTEAMIDSGDRVDLSRLPGITVDKHSTGGVGDKTTLVLGPLLAAAGMTVAKMSGRGLGHTGGTLDKLEAIPGFRTDLSPEELVSQVEGIGLAVAAQSGRLVPADGLLYALRDVTATVDSLPLIASSIMSKKLAAGAQAMILDVKTGAGAFMRRPDDSFALAAAMIAIGRAAGRRTVALVTDMERPLGRAVGNSLEVAEAIETLRGGGPADLRELCLALGSWLLPVARGAGDAVAARGELEGLLAGGEALESFRLMVLAQGGDPAVVERPAEILPRAALQRELYAPMDGYVAAIDALAVGEAARDLGAGRRQKGDAIDPAAGILLQATTGDRLRQGRPWATLYARDEALLDAGAQRLGDALRIEAAPLPAAPLVYGAVHPDGRVERFA